MQKIAIYLFGLIIALALITCTSKNPANGPEIVLTDEAQLAALWLSDEIHVPENLALEIQNKLELIREQFSDQIPEVNIEFVFPVNPQAVYLTMEDYAFGEVKSGTYHEWDSLNQLYGVDSIYIGSEEFRWINVIFNDYINPYILAPEYALLPGVKYSNEGISIGDWSNTYPWIIDGELAFLVRYAWGDCPAGCTYSKFWYFKSEGSQMVLAGNFEIDDDFYQNPSYPLWWDEIAPAYYKYEGFKVEPE